MQIISKDEKVRNIAEDWRKQYGRDGIYIKLLSAKTEADISRDIGNDSWIVNVCDECEADVPALIQIGEPPGFESQTAKICPACLEKALKLLTA